MVITHYSENTFAIDIIADSYSTTDPVEIQAKSKDILDISLSISEILDYLTLTEDFEQSSNTIKMKDLFYDTVAYE